MRITKSPPKNQYSQPPPWVLEFIKEIQNEETCPIEKVASLCSDFRKREWAYPRGDLYSWIPVLNRFDAILEKIVEDYELKNKVQARPFDSLIFTVLLEVLKFSTYLLKHCANRSIYNSTTYLEQLLNSSDLEILDATLALLLHIVQKATISRRGKQLFSLSQDRLFRFLSFLPQEATKCGLAQNYESVLFLNDIPASWCGLEFSYYKSSPSAASDASKAASPASLPSEGLRVLKLSPEEMSAKSANELLLQLSNENQIPEQYAPDLLVSLLLHKNLPDLNKRRLMVRIGLLALSNLVYAHSQAVQSRFMLADPEITTHLATLVSVDTKLPQEFKAVVFECFKAFFFRKNMVPSVLASLNVSVSYGLMMNLVRDFSNNLSDEKFDYSRDYVDSFYDFLQFMTTSPLGGNMACSAGLTSLLGHHLSLKSPRALYVVSRSVAMLDHLIDGYSMAFPDFSESKGLDLLVDRLQFELEAGLDDVKSGRGNTEIFLNMDYAIPYDRYFLLKNLLKFILHLIQTGGSVVELRNLIDSSLISSLAFLLDHHEVFGSNLFASATNIMSTFIHNEPTCYGIIHEKKLSHAFLDAVNRQILNSSDAITSIPLAFGAICLNSQGFNLFLEKNPVSHFFSVFLSYNHCKSLTSSDNAAILGTYIDELMRHQPSLKDGIVTMIFEIVDKVSDLLRTFNPLDFIGATDFPYLVYFETFSSFLENIISNEGHARNLMSKGLIPHILKLMQIPVLAYGFVDSSAFNTFFVLLHHIIDFDAAEVFRPLLDCIIFNCENSNVEQSLNSINVIVNGQLNGQLVDLQSSESFFQFTIIGNLISMFSELFSSYAALKKAGNLPLVQLFISPSRYAGVFDILCNIKNISTSVDVFLCSQASSDYALCCGSLASITADKKEKESLENKKRDLKEDPSFNKFKNIRTNFTQTTYSISKFFTSLTRALGNSSIQDINEFKGIYKLGSNIALVVDELVGMACNQILTREGLPDELTLHIALMSILDASAIIREDDSKVTLTLLISRIFAGSQTLQLLLQLCERVTTYFALVNEDITSRKNRILLALSSTLLNLVLTLTSADFMSETEKPLNFSLKIQLDNNELNDCGSKLMHLLQAHAFLSMVKIWQSAADYRLPYITKALVTNVLSNCFQFEEGIKSLSENAQSNSAESHSQSNQEKGLQEGPKLSDTVNDETLLNLLIREAPSNMVVEFNNFKSNLVKTCVSLSSYEGDVNQSLCDLLYSGDEVQMNSNLQLDTTMALVKEIKFLASLDKADSRNSQFGPAVGLLSLFVSHDFTQNKAKNYILEELDFFLNALESMPQYFIKDINATWVVSILFLLEVLLTNSKKPDEFEFNSTDCSLKLIDGSISINYVSQQKILVCLIKLMKQYSSNLGVVTSAMRLTVLITASYDMVHVFVDSNGLEALFSAMKACAAVCNEALHIPFISILRRLLESERVIELIMFDDLRNIFKLQGRARKTELLNFIRTNSEMVLRSPDCFTKMIKETCQLAHFAPNADHHYLDLKENLPESYGKDQINSDASLMLQTSSKVVSALLDEIMETVDFRRRMQKNASAEFKPESDPMYMHNVFLLQCLTELLSGYDSCKKCFMEYQPKRKSSFFSLSRKYNSYLVGFFLEKLLPFGSIRLSEDNEIRKAFSVSNWAISILVFLCAYSNDQQTDVVDEIRREVLSCVLKFYRSSSVNSESLESYYCKLLVVAELCYRLGDAQTVSQKAPNHLLRKSQDINIKAMIDLGFIPALTSATSEIDMNYPVSRKVIRHILRPLQLLTKEAIFLSQTNPESLSGNMQEADTDESVSDESEESEGDEPPDLYRNSVLGIFQGDIANENNDNYEGSEDDDVYEEMDFEDEQSGSPGSVVSEDENDDTMYSDNNDMNIEFMLDGDQDGSEQEDTSSYDDDESSHGDIISIDEEDIDNSGEPYEWEDEGNDTSEYEHDEEFNDQDEENGSTTFEAMENAFTEASEDENDDEAIDHVSPVEIDFLDNEEGSSSEQDEDFHWEWNADVPSGAEIISRHGALLRDLFPLPGLSRRVMIINSGDNARSRSFLNNRSSEDILKHPLLLKNYLSNHEKVAELCENLSDLDSHVSSGAASQRLLFYLSMNTSSSDSSSLGWTALKNQIHNDPLRATSDFTPLFTMQRWSGIVSMFFGHAAGSTALRVTGSVLFGLIPPALENHNREKEESERQSQPQNDERSAETVPPVEQNVNDQNQESNEMEGVTTEQAGPAEETTNVDEGQTINIRGRDVNVSSLGIDPTFLLALPEDMREEIVFQHIQERHIESISDSSRRLDPSFLEVLPSDIRDELLFQEAVQMRLFDNARNNEGADNELEMEGLDEADEADDEQKERSVKPIKKVPVPPLLDRSGILSMIRLLYIPQHNGKNPFYDLVVNVSENKQQRAEVLGLLLYVLQEASASTRSTEKCYKDLTVRSLNVPQQKEFKKYHGLLDSLCKVPVINGISSRSLILQQSIDLLSHLSTWADHFPSFFLSMQDFTGLPYKKSGSKKSKETNVYKLAPINVLLGLLGREEIFGNTLVMNTFSELLSTLTRPLLSFYKHQKPEADVKVSAGTRDDSENTDVSAPKAEGSSAPGEKKGKKSLNPPQITDENLRLAASLITTDSCSSRTFQNALSVMFHLCSAPHAKNIIGKELLRHAQEYGNAIIGDLSGLCGEIKRGRNENELQNALAPFCPASSNQAKLLRCLKALDYIFERRPKREEQSPQNIVQLLEFYDNLQFVALWDVLSDCLVSMREQSSITHVSTVLLPLIESLMVICRPVYLDLPEEVCKQISPMLERLKTLFITFTEEHRKIINMMVFTTPSLMSGSFSLLVKNPKVLEFENKRNYFSRQLHAEAAKEQYPPLNINVRRDQVFLDSYRALHFKDADEVKYSKLNIHFREEEGVDAGGVTREWLQVLARQMFNPDYALFLPVAGDATTFHPNRDSSVNPDHLSFFKFTGRIIGKSVYDGRLLDCHFSRAVYKHMLHRSVSVKDIESLDPDYCKSLVWMLNNDITDIITEEFAVEKDVFGEKTIVDLIPNGRNIPVTELNKHDYVNRMVDYKLVESVKDQLQSLLEGFSDIIPPNLIQIFNEQELELLISGLPEIDIDDWRNNTEYHGYNVSSPQIQWFWRAVRSFDEEERAKLLQFATGTSKVPLNGFKELEGMSGFQRFNIHKSYGSLNRLPQSHTCFNQLDLPEYETYEQLRTMLLTAINEGSEGFGFA
ncbi:HECT-type ubiquitin ligase E3 Ptr1 [Schizosaccharomyces cryophilus OY26]|uniref:HECT-type E3 ubiquitin transferase n=1 Tax=Schizosaccharomyces cryophilus (strain OY26 / ATCC MYA-4695 / CBS 11777 / NBRC 106824 / NRRL Y48691) TaxID=653667 RepID=S9VVK6_SCHCR|nr:HECT-type ubiquitin ligase E3 Ptr1 [Schizosaccharomyces cryophilus OY26]EPY50204.1 HECT-type ubiquitin ligase E3 Ptr1 [Schizosaccharomyces cryophilus OY26]